MFEKPSLQPYNLLPLPMFYHSLLDVPSVRVISNNSTSPSNHISNFPHSQLEMSLVPFLLNELLEDYRRPNMGDLYDQNFGMGLAELLRPHHHQHHGGLLHTPLRSGYLRPWRHMEAGDSGISTLTNDSKEFKVNLDVQQFKPEELKVTVDKGFLVVNGKHEERSDEHGFISRQFTRKYKIPEDVDAEALASKLSSDGVLSLHAPKIVKAAENEARQITITHTNQPLRVKEDKKKKDGKQETMETN